MLVGRLGERRSEPSAGVATETYYILIMLLLLVIMTIINIIINITILLMIVSIRMVPVEHIRDGNPAGARATICMCI